MLNETIHGTCVRWQNQGILILGQSGAGKSDLAIQIIDAGGILIADDIVKLHPENGKIIGSAYENGQGLIELFGQGIYKLPFENRTAIHAVVELVDHKDLARLPEAKPIEFCGIAINHVKLLQHGSSNLARLRTCLRIARID